MPVWMAIGTNIFIPIIVIINMIYDHKKGKRCVDISVWVVALLCGDICYYLGTERYSSKEMIYIVAGNFFIYFFYWLVAYIILGINKGEIEPWKPKAKQ